MKNKSKESAMLKRHHTLSLHWLFYDHTRWLFAPIAALMFRTKKTYVDKKATLKEIKNGAMVISNHISFYDALIYQYAFMSRRIHTMLLQTAFNKKIGAWFFKEVNCFPVDPDKLSFDTIRHCVTRLQYGYVVLTFPEGHINFEKNPQVKGFRSGSIFLAVQANRPIIPCFLYRQKGFFHRFHLYIGKPFYPRDYFEGSPTVGKLQKVTDRLFEIESKMQSEYLEKVKAK